MKPVVTAADANTQAMEKTTMLINGGNQANPSTQLAMADASRSQNGAIVTDVLERA